MASAAASEIVSLNPEYAELEERLANIEKRLDTTGDPNHITLLVFSGELDKLLAAFNIANAAAACGTKVSMFFTFWGIASLKAKTVYGHKNFIERAFGFMLPGGFSKRQLSRLDMAGLGRALLSKEMRNKNVADLPAGIETAKKLGVDLYLCEMTMNLMGISEEELIDYSPIHYCGATKFLAFARNANTTLFI